MMADELLTSFQSPGEIRLSWLGCHLTILIEQFEDPSLEAVRIWRQGWHRQIIIGGVMGDTGRIESINLPSFLLQMRCSSSRILR